MASLTLLAVLALTACTTTVDGAAAPTPIPEPELVTFDPPLAFDPTAETLLNLGPIAPGGSTLTLVAPS